MMAAAQMHKEGRLVQNIPNYEDLPESSKGGWDHSVEKVVPDTPMDRAKIPRDYEGTSVGPPSTDPEGPRHLYLRKKLSPDLTS